MKRNCLTIRRLVTQSMGRPVNRTIDYLYVTYKWIRSAPRAGPGLIGMPSYSLHAWTARGPAGLAGMLLFRGALKCLKWPGTIRHPGTVINISSDLDSLSPTHTRTRGVYATPTPGASATTSMANFTHTKPKHSKATFSNCVGQFNYNYEHAIAALRSSGMHFISQFESQLRVESPLLDFSCF